MPIELKDYKILHKYQGNSLNKVYRVENKITKQIFVLKIIRVQNLEQQKREIQLHKTLKHKYIIKLIDYEVKNGKIIILLEYAENGNLFRFLNKIRKFSKQKQLIFFYKILLSVCYCHSRKIVHRDIKPENILINQKYQPKLADFGTVGMISQIDYTFCGTYEYMAPEIYLRAKQTEKVDTWSLGILFYEITHNKTPFKGDSLKEIKRKIDERSVEFKDDFSEDLKDFIYDMLVFNAKKRPTCFDVINHKVFNQVFDQKKVISQPKKTLPVKKDSETAPSETKELSSSFAIRRFVQLKSHSQKDLNQSYNSIRVLKSKCLPLTLQQKLIVRNPELCKSGLDTSKRSISIKKVQTPRALPSQFRNIKQRFQKIEYHSFLGNTMSRDSQKFQIINSLNYLQSIHVSKIIYVFISSLFCIVKGLLDRSFIFFQ